MAGLKPMILLHQLLECWEYKCDLLCPVSLSWGPRSTRVAMTVVWTVLTVTLNRPEKRNTLQVSHQRQSLRVNCWRSRDEGQRGQRRRKHFQCFSGTHRAFVVVILKAKRKGWLKSTHFPMATQHGENHASLTLSFPSKPSHTPDECGTEESAMLSPFNKC